MLLERVRVVLVLADHLHDDVVLVEPRVHGGDLALAEGVVEHVVDGLHGEAEAEAVSRSMTSRASSPLSC